MADKKISALTSASTPLAGTEVLPIVQSSTTVKVAVSNLTAGRTVNASSFVATGDVTAGGSVTISRNPATGKVTIADSTAEPYTQGMDFRNYEDGSTGAAYRFQNGDGSATAVSIGGSVDGLSTTGNVKISTAGKGIDFSANTHAAGMTSELLNWYEEGTWTPVLRGATTAGTYETASISGRYTRIGRQVTIQCYMEFANVITGGGSGYAQITGLPFAKAADTTFPTGALFTKGVDWTAGTPIVAPITSGSTSVLYFPEIIDNAANNNIDISGFSAQDVIAFTLTYNAT